MLAALNEAARALGRTRPNPVVGCVIARGDRILGVGHHARAGTDHAEVAALKHAGTRARGADAYVTLEPCDHWGRTGPCSEALIEAGVKRVFAGMRDPNPIVNGRGAKRLAAAGIKVEVGLLEAECRRLNEAYVRYIRDGRPFVVVKIAQSLDGRVATRTGQSRWISGPGARRAGHVLRNQLDAILVGRGTVAADDPKLTCRVHGGRDPVRIVLDSKALTPPSAKVVTAARHSHAPTWIVVGKDAPARRRVSLERAGAEIIVCRTRHGRIDLEALLSLLRERELTSILVEGGPTVTGSFFDYGLVDKVHLFLAPIMIGGEGARASVGGRGVAELSDAWRLEGCHFRVWRDDLELIGYPRRQR